MHYSQSLRQNIYVGDEAVSFEQNCSPRSQSIRKENSSDYIISQLQREVEELGLHERDCDSLQEDIRQMEARIADVNTELAEQADFYRTEREGALFKIARAQTQLRQQLQKHSDGEKEFRRYLLDNQDAEMLMKNRHHKFVESTETLKDMTLNYKNIKCGADHLRKEAQKVAQDKLRLRSVIEKTESQLNTKLGDFKSLKERLAELQSKHTSYTEVLYRIQRDNTLLAKEEAILERRLKETEKQIFSLSIDLNNLANETQKSKNEAFTLKAEIITLENKISKRSELLTNSDSMLADLEKLVDSEKSTIDKKLELLAQLKDQQKGKEEVLTSKQTEIDSFRFKCDLFKKFSQRAFDELKNYVKLDRTINDCFARAYNPEGLQKKLGESQHLRHSALKSY